MATRTRNETRSIPQKTEEKPAKKSLGQVLMETVRLKGPEGTTSADEIARAFRPVKPGEEKGKEVWRTFTRQVRGEAIGLARKGEIDILRRGEVIDPGVPFKGLYRLRLKQHQPETDQE